MQTCYKIICALLVSATALTVCSADSMADVKIAKIGDTVVDTNALTIKGHFGQAINGTSFQQEAIVTHGAHQYVGYYDGKREVCIARRKLPTGEWEIVRFTDYDFRSNDSHNIISLGVCPADGTLHLAFDHHNAPLHYTYGPNERLHVTWVWRETGGTPNHDLMYAYSEDKGKTWLNNLGQELEGPAHANSPEITVVPIPSQYGLMNTHGQAVDSHGRIHVVMWHCTDESLKAAGTKPGKTRWGPEEARRYHHYWRDENANWHHRELPWISGTRPKLFMDKNENAFLIYSTRSKLYSTRGNLVIASATAASKWTDWKIVHEEEGPFVNEMLGDPCRWKKDGILSVLVQESPETHHEATPLRILDYTLEQQ